MKQTARHIFILPLVIGISLVISFLFDGFKLTARNAAESAAATVCTYIIVVSVLKAANVRKK